MKKNIVTDKIALKNKCELVTEEELPSVLQDLEDSFVDIAKRGYGLSAPQIGISKQVSIVRVGEVKLNLVNPEIIEKEGRFLFQKEGCLSFPGIYIDTDRYKEITIENGIGENRKQYYTYGIEAVVLQHEIDHLSGTLFFDRKHRKRR